MMMIYKKYLLFLEFFIIYNVIGAKNCKPKIAIIGGGIGGASTSHFLTKLFEGNLEIDLFEAKNIGGRLSTIDINDNQYETGGSIIHEKNQLMKYFINFLELEKKSVGGTGRMGIWNGDEFVFEESSSETMTLLKLIYRYGLQPFWLDRLVNSIVDDFGKIYHLHDNGIGFDNVSSLLSAMNSKFPQMMQVSTKDYLKDLGYSPKIIDELIKAMLVVNYGQDSNIHSFVGSVGVAGAGSSLWSVKGGNRKVPENLINQNKKVNVFHAAVETVSYFPKNDGTPQYNVFYHDKACSEVMNKLYDIVVIATPLTHDHEGLIKFKNLPENINKEFDNEYQIIFATFVTGRLKPQYFSLVDPIDVISCNPNNTIFNCVGKLSNVEGVRSNVWKLFSSHLLEKDFLKKIFDPVEDIQVIKWQAYPKYSSNVGINQFKLHNALYYVNAIEWAASAMEMSAISGRNIAILIHNNYKQNCKNF